MNEQPLRVIYILLTIMDARLNIEIMFVDHVLDVWE